MCLLCARLLALLLFELSCDMKNVTVKPLCRGVLLAHTALQPDSLHCRFAACSMDQLRQTAVGCWPDSCCHDAQPARIIAWGMVKQRHAPPHCPAPVRPRAGVTPGTGTYMAGIKGWALLAALDAVRKRTGQICCTPSCTIRFPHTLLSPRAHARSTLAEDHPCSANPPQSAQRSLSRARAIHCL